jgi:hypothetical protein
MKLRWLKVQIDVIKSWVKRRIEDMIGDDDDVVVNMTLSLLDQDHQMGQSDKKLDPKDMQVYLTGRAFPYLTLCRFPGGSHWALRSGIVASPSVSSGHTHRDPT